MYLKNIAMIVYRCKAMPSAANIKIFFNIFGQNMSIENLNRMPSEVRQNVFESFCSILV